MTDDSEREGLLAEISKLRSQNTTMSLAFGLCAIILLIFAVRTFSGSHVTIDTLQDGATEATVRYYETSWWGYESTGQELRWMQTGDLACWHTRDEDGQWRSIMLEPLGYDY